MVHEMPLKLYFMKCSERKIPQCILPLICYWMLQNSRATSFSVFELLRENQLGGKITPLPSPPPRLGLKGSYTQIKFLSK